MSAGFKPKPLLKHTELAEKLACHPKSVQYQQILWTDCITLLQVLPVFYKQCEPAAGMSISPSNYAYVQWMKDRGLVYPQVRLQIAQEAEAGEPELPAHPVPQPKPPLAADPTPPDPWDALQNQVANCAACQLSTQRQQAFSFQKIVAEKAQLLFVADAINPQGELFEPKERELFQKMVAAMGVPGDQHAVIPGIYCPIGTFRQQWESPTQTCGRLNLSRIIELLKPAAVVALGPAAWRALNPDGPLPPFSRVRGQWESLKPVVGTSHIPMLATYHPRQLLRQPQAKADAWKDLQSVMEALDLPR